MKGTKRLPVVLLSQIMAFTAVPAIMGMKFAKEEISEGLFCVS